MEINIYCIYDKVAEESGPLFTAVNDGIAIRQFRNIPIPPSLKNDYQLCRIGTYNTKDMSIIPEVLYTIEIPHQLEESINE